MTSHPTIFRMFRRAALHASLGAVVLSMSFAAESAPPPAAAIKEDLRGFGIYATVLHVAAHPDDENRLLLAYLSRVRNYRTGYLSITRGDGGQNEIGGEFGEKLGLARTHELLAGRRFDGARQFFTRALDFGYSKSMAEALAVWDHDQVLGDVVRVIRTFRPDVIVTRFSPQAQKGNHGHHNASALLAVEAFKIAGDPKSYPEQIAEGLKPWQPKRILQNGGTSLSIAAGGSDPVTGDAVQTIASRTSAQHKTQFGPGGGGGGRGPSGGAGARQETFGLLGGEPAKDDIMDGIDLTWARVPGGAEIGRLTTNALAEFKDEDPSASVPALLAIRSKLAALPSDPVVDDKRGQLDRILAGCLGLTVETTARQAEVVPGDRLKLTVSVSLSAKSQVRWLSADVKFPGGNVPLDRSNASGPTADIMIDVPAGLPVSQPYWLREEAGPGMFRVTDPKLVGLPDNPPVFTVEYSFDVGGQRLVLTDEPVAKSATGRLPRTLIVTSPVALRFGSGVVLFTPGAKKPIEVEVTAARGNSIGVVHIEAPTGWSVSPASQPFKLGNPGDKARLVFSATAPVQAASGSFLAVADIGGARFSNQRVEIRYDHIPLQILQPPARVRAVAVEFAAKGKAVGYLPGAGDDTAQALEQLGYKVTTLTGADLNADKLRGLDAVVIGVRAFNERTDLAANFPGLLAFVEGGGNVIAQYNRPNGLNTPQLGPYSLSIQGPAPALRVTEEDAPVTFLAPDHAALTTPNKITQADFTGWVQERGAYFPSSWDQERYVAILSMNDKGEQPLKSSLLIAKHGKGNYIYTGIAFFRQLPAGNPGAYRLFANLVSLGK